MTEQEWLTSADPARMLAWLTAERGPSGYYVRHNDGRPLSTRKLWLFVAAVERLWWGEQASPRDRKEVEKLEAIADGRLSESRLGGLVFSYTMPWNAADCAREAVRVHNSRGDLPRWAALLREIVGNPFRPATLETCPRCEGDGEAHGSDRPFEWTPEEGYPGKCPACKGFRYVKPPWLTPRVLSVASAAYDLREWDRLPVLADALSDGGCEDAATLDHLRGPGPHVRGCWALDLLLGLG